MAEQIEQDKVDFERQRNQLMQLSSQKQQLQFQSRVLKDALEEISKTKEEKVYKAVGNIMILSPVTEVKKDLEKEVEALDLRVKTVQKQEDITVDKMNKLKNKIEGKNKETKEDKEED
ncbi:prefoldin subunit [Candidatus Micrarchaeota archaeon]|nr:prefoldin subunit [Candidatus Micrarchaeota archaeon]